MESFVSPLLLKKIDTMDISDVDKQIMKQLMNLEIEYGSNRNTADVKIKKFREVIARGLND